MIWWVLVVTCFAVVGGMHPDVNLSLEEKVHRHGYGIDTHKVLTDDGHILTLYRLRHPTKVGNSSMLIMYGMGGTVDYYMLMPNVSLPYLLLENNFDVWMLTCRGHDGGHVKYDWNKDQEYWRFSLHEIAVYDVKAQIDYVTKFKKEKKVFYLGHSAGGTQIHILLSERPEYNKKIKIGFSYASSPLMRRMDYPLTSLLIQFLPLFKSLAKYLDMGELFPQMQMLKPTLKLICSEPQFLKACLYFTNIIGTHKSILADRNLIGVMASLQPQRLSTQQLFHYGDNVNSGDFRKFDYGAKKNMELYGQVLPPKYNLSRVTAPLAFFYAAADGFSVKYDMYESMNQFPNVVVDYEVPHKLYTHTDFILAYNALEMVYEPTMRIMQDYDNGIIPKWVGRKHIPDDEPPVIV